MEGEHWMDIRSDRQKGLSCTEIVRKYHIDPRTAKKHVESDTRPVYSLSGTKPSKLDPYKEQITVWLEEAPYSAAQIENDILTHNFAVPHHMKVNELFEQFINLYGQKNWQPKTYESNLMLMEKHVIPYIGEYAIQAITPITIESLFLRSHGSKLCWIR